MNSQAIVSVKRIADSTVRRLSAYLRFLEDFEGRGLTTISSEELAKRGGTTSAQVRKDLSFFGSFGKRGPRLFRAGARRPPARNPRARHASGRSSSSAPERSARRSRSTAASGSAASASSRPTTTTPTRSGRRSKAFLCATSRSSSATSQREQPDIAVLTVPGEEAQAVVDRSRGRHQGDPQLRADAASGAGRRHGQDRQHGDGARGSELRADESRVARRSLRLVTAGRAPARRTRSGDSVSGRAVGSISRGGEHRLRLLDRELPQRSNDAAHLLAPHAERIEDEAAKRGLLLRRHGGIVARLDAHDGAVDLGRRRETSRGRRETAASACATACTFTDSAPYASDPGAATIRSATSRCTR